MSGSRKHGNLSPMRVSGGLSLKGVYKVYKMDGVSVRAINGIDLTIGPGEYVAIMGPSGSGKSTLMNMAGCLDRPTSGDIYIGGLATGKLRDRELAELRGRHIGFVFQSFNLLSRTTALANVELPLIYQGLGRIERRRKARDALKAVGLSHRMEHRPSQLSGGEQQRVAIARALVSQPRMVLADEPTGNLDSRSGEEVLRILDGLSREGITLLLVTHDRIVAEHAERIIHLQDGCLVRNEIRQQENKV